MSWQTLEVTNAFPEESTNPEPHPPVAMVEAIQNLRDEISVLSVKGHGFGSRELAMVLTNLDQARLWAIEYGINHGSHLLVDKRKYKEGLAATATQPTEPTERSNGNV